MPGSDAGSQKGQRKEEGPLWKHSGIPRKALLKKRSILECALLVRKPEDTGETTEAVLAHGSVETKMCVSKETDAL